MDAYPRSIECPCPVSALFPFQLAAAAARSNDNNNSGERQADFSQLERIFNLLRACPQTIALCGHINVMRNEIVQSIQRNENHVSS